jgi:outer membrane protein assembly factor BamB
VEFSHRINSGGQGFTASPVSDGRHLYLTSEPGMTFVVAVTNQYTLVATNSLGETCLVTPAISEGMLFFRTRSKLIAIAEP